MHALSPEAWTGNLDEEKNGLVVLGVPVGRDAFVREHGRQRLVNEGRLLEQLPSMKDAQCAWALLLHSAVPRANYTLRTVPPTLSKEYAAAYDEAVWECFCAITGAGDWSGDATARELASLSGTHSGLGLNSATRTGPAAYWASWAGALPGLAGKSNALASLALTRLDGAGRTPPSCLAEAEAARTCLSNEGAQNLPTWRETALGAKPPKPTQDEEEMFGRGWQRHASAAVDRRFKENEILPKLSPASRALLRSQSCPDGSSFLRALPSERGYCLRPLRFLTALRRRLRWRIPLAGGQCKGASCQADLDPLGDHAAACCRSRPAEALGVTSRKSLGPSAAGSRLHSQGALPSLPSADTTNAT